MRLRQLRAFRLDDVQVADAGHVVFHSSIFGVKDSYETIFDRGCFSKTVNDHSGMFPVVWFHNPTEPIALGNHVEDAKGLRVEADLDLEVETGRRVYSGLRKGYIDCASIAFSCVTEAREDDIMHFREVELWESSLLTRNFASNEAALVDEVRARTGIDYPRPPVVAVTESDLRSMIEALRGLQRRELTDAEATLVTQCSTALQTMIAPEEGRPYPNEHACRLQAPSKFSDFRRGTRKHEGKVYSIIFGKLKDSDDWEEQAYRYAKDVWEAADARAHCKSHDGSFEAASGEAARSCALGNTSPESPSIALPSTALIAVQRELAAARASRGPARPPSETRRTPIIAPDIHAVITDLRALGGRL